MTIDGKNGYKISYESIIPEGAETVIIAMHGFCGDKESGCIGMLQECAVASGMGLIKFDWPGHGESEATGDQLTLENCVSDISTMVDFAKSQAPNAKIVAFSTSFGGYLTLLFEHYNPGVFDKVILRSPAIKMCDVLKNNILNDEMLEKLEREGSIEYGFERMLKITKEFVDSLERENLLQLLSGRELSNYSIIHGTIDDLVPFADSEEFAKEHGCKLFPVEGADHRYKKPGELDKVMEISMSILGD